MIQHVDAALCTYLARTLPDLQQEGQITFSPLARADEALALRLNLLLYDVRPSADYRSQPPGGFRQRSAGEGGLTLDLTYLATAHGMPEAAHRLLGDLAVALHRLPLLTVDGIEGSPLRVELFAPPEPLLAPFWLAMRAEPRPGLHLRVHSLRVSEA